ncbi:MAG: bifunctional oligoribonuclease/PAP phosphatase NrnA [Lachnospiraceae bacterium]|nr:bifunctional oligoribonuclease/PAP phosphatase NrnA [Lachnospiraceae bacterium]
MKKLEELVPENGSVIILGHVRPDGDCVGSCLAAYNYLKKLRPAQELKLILEPFSDSFRMLSGSETVSHDFAGTADICVCLDTSDRERLGKGTDIFDRAAVTICIDHHHTNTGFADVNIICGDISSASELLAGMLSDEFLDREIAECLYLGIVHDTGCFKHSNTRKATMETAGKLLEYGVSSSRIIDDTFFRKTFRQNRLLGTALTRSELFLSGKMIGTAVTRQDMEALGADSRDTDGIVDQIRVTDGVEIAVFLYELTPGEFKISMRSNDCVDVSEIAGHFGGGGHIRAAGGSSKDSPERIFETIAALAEAQLKRQAV